MANSSKSPVTPASVKKNTENKKSCRFYFRIKIFSNIPVSLCFKRRAFNSSMPEKEVM